MLESGLRFAFAFLPAGVAVVIGLVIAVQRRRVLPEVSTPAIWGLGLQLLAILVSASVNLVPSLFLGAGVQTALTVSVVIGIVTVLLTVVSWVLILTALFRRLPARSEAPTTMTPAQASPAVPRRVGPTPPADDAPTGRHALLDERGQQVVAQEGVRLYPQAAAIAGGVATGAVLAGRGDSSGPLPTDGSRVEEMPTEAVPVLPRADEGAAAPSAGGAAAPDDEAGDPVDEAAEQPDPGPAGVDEAAVGGTPTGPADEPAAASPAAASSAPPTGLPAATPVAASTGGVGSGPAGAATPPVSDEGPAGVDEAAVGGTPVEPTTHDDASASTATLAGLATAASVPGLDPAADDPSLDDPSLDETDHDETAVDKAASSTAVPETPGAKNPAVEDVAAEDVAAEDAVPDDAASVSADGDHDAPPPDPSPISVDEGAVGGVPTGASGADTPPRVTAPARASHPGPGSVLRPATPDHTTPEGTTPPTTGSGPASSPAGAPTPATTTADPTTRTSSPAGSDLFAPSRSTTTAEPASVPGWFEPVTDSAADLEEPEPAVESRNGHTTEH